MSVDNELIYEVSVSLKVEARMTVISFMRETHISQVLEHAAFSHAEFFEEQIDNADAERFSFTTHYYIKDTGKFQDYLDNHSPALRQDFMQRFGQYAPAFSRRILKKNA